MDIIAKMDSIGDAPENPFALFRKWLEDAKKSEPDDPDAMSLATIDANGRLGLRMVLLKEVDERGFVFFTNRESRKGYALEANPVAAVCFHWKSLRRQIRIEGAVERISDSESDAYYKTRPFGSRIGAWASLQSRPLENHSILASRVSELEKEYLGREALVPRPDYWGGYRIVPDSIEFWHDGRFRLHRRVVYTKSAHGESGGEWNRQMLYP